MPHSAAAVSEVLAGLTREVPDFPQPGVTFRDLTPVLADDRGFAVITDALTGLVAGADLIAGIDARGFLLGGAVAQRLGVGVLAIRKSGKLPPPVLSRTYDLEYGSATLEIPAEGIALAGRRVAIVDDVLATGERWPRAGTSWRARARMWLLPRWSWNWWGWAAGTCSGRCRCTAFSTSDSRAVPVPTPVPRSAPAAGAVFRRRS